MTKEEFEKASAKSKSNHDARMMRLKKIEQRALPADPREALRLMNEALRLMKELSA